MNNNEILRKIKKHEDKDIPELREQLDNIVKEKISKGEGGAITSDMLSQEVKASMTGGSVAIVGKNAVLTENIVNKQVTPIKTSFLVLDKNKNLFDGNTFLEGFKLTGDNATANIETDMNSIIAIIPIESSKNYSILIDKLELEYNGNKYFKYMTSANLYIGAQNNVQHTLNNAKYSNTFNFTSSATDKYLYVYVSDKKNKNALIQVLEGYHNNISIKNYEECFMQNFNVKNDFLTTHNLFDGNSYLKDISISGSNSSNFTLAKNANCITAIVKIEGNKDYSVVLSETPMFYDPNYFFKWCTSDTLYISEVYQGTMRIGKCGSVLNKKYVNFTSSATDKYLYIYTNDSNRTDILIEVAEGIQSKLTINENGQDFKPSHKLSVYSKNEVLALIDNVSKLISNSNSVLNNKMWVFLGDSITYGVGCSNGFDYPTIIKNKYGVNAINGAISGGRYAKVDGSVNNDLIIAQQIKNQAEYIKKADIVSVLCGTNDFANVVQFGEEASTSEYTLNGGINNAISSIYALNPKVRIILFTPFYRATQSYTDDKNSDDFPLGGKYLYEYCNQIENAGKRHHVPVFNLNDISGINRYNASLLLSDKLHLSDAGSEFLAPTIHGCVASLF